MKADNHETNWNAVGKRDLKRAAIHEAGHAIVCTHFGVNWFLSKLERRRPTRYERGATAQIAYQSFGGRMTVFREAVIGWAGELAVMLLDDQTLDMEGYYEVETIYDLILDDDATSQSDLKAIMGTRFKRRALKTAAGILKRRWKEVEELADSFISGLDAPKNTGIEAAEKKTAISPEQDRLLQTLKKQLRQRARHQDQKMGILITALRREPPGKEP
jgi:hypothetical protein